MPVDYVHVTAGACRGQKASDSLKMQLHAIESCQIWVMGTELFKSHMYAS